MPAMAVVRFGSFSPSLPHLIAVREGCYADRGVYVEQDRIPSSPALRKAFRDGDLDVVLTAPDNIANYRLNGSARERLDVRIIAAVDRAGSVSLMGRPGLTSPGDIRGGEVAVDARDSGYAFLLYELLRRRGLSLGDDYSVAEMGGTPDRFRQLSRGACDATILNTGFDASAEALGCTRLARAADAVPGYLTTVLAAQGRWLDAVPDEVSRFLSAFFHAAGYLLSQDYRSRCLALITETWNVSAPVAARILSEVTDSQTGLIPDGAVRDEPLEATLRLRQRWGGFTRDADIAGEIRRPKGLVDRRFTPA
jgi:ABC-type nitrate/sulfonate/bicarbonate transport system substrate-binding protein